jgi:predicted transcriptional regulator
VHETLAGLGQPVPATEPERPQPAVPIRKSVTPGYLICLEDGKKLKMLKRYLQNRYNMTPNQYRARWDLPNDYPMVAPEIRRASLDPRQVDRARHQGESHALPMRWAVEVAAPKRRGRPKKVVAGV